MPPRYRSPKGKRSPTAKKASPTAKRASPTAKRTRSPGGGRHEAQPPTKRGSPPTQTPRPTKRSTLVHQTASSPGPMADSSDYSHTEYDSIEYDSDVDKYCQPATSMPSHGYKAFLVAVALHHETVRDKKKKQMEDTKKQKEDAKTRKEDAKKQKEDAEQRTTQRRQQERQEQRDQRRQQQQQRGQHTPSMHQLISDVFDDSSLVTYPSAWWESQRPM